MSRNRGCRKLKEQAVHAGLAGRSAHVVSSCISQSEMTALVPADRLRGVVVFIPFVTVS